jgi:hypothetical protein
MKYQDALSSVRNVSEPLPSLDQVLLAIAEEGGIVASNHRGPLFYPYQLRSFEALEGQGLIRSETTQIVSMQGRYLLVKYVPTAKGLEKCQELKLAA